MKLTQKFANAGAAGPVSPEKEKDGPRLDWTRKPGWPTPPAPRIPGTDPII